MAKRKPKEDATDEGGTNQEPEVVTHEQPGSGLKSDPAGKSKHGQGSTATCPAVPTVRKTRERKTDVVIDVQTVRGRIKTSSVSSIGKKDSPRKNTEKLRKAQNKQKHTAKDSQGINKKTSGPKRNSGLLAKSATNVKGRVASISNSKIITGVKSAYKSALLSADNSVPKKASTRFPTATTTSTAVSSVSPEIPVEITSVVDSTQEAEDVQLPEESTKAAEVEVCQKSSAESLLDGRQSGTSLAGEITNVQKVSSVTLTSSKSQECTSQMTKEIVHATKSDISVNQDSQHSSNSSLLSAPSAHQDSDISLVSNHSIHEKVLSITTRATITKRVLPHRLKVQFIASGSDLPSMYCPLSPGDSESSIEDDLDFDSDPDSDPTKYGYHTLSRDQIHKLPLRSNSSVSLSSREEDSYLPLEPCAKVSSCSTCTDRSRRDEEGSIDIFFDKEGSVEDDDDIAIYDVPQSCSHDSMDNAIQDTVKDAKEAEADSAENGAIHAVDCGSKSIQKMIDDINVVTHGSLPVKRDVAVTPAVAVTEFRTISYTKSDENIINEIASTHNVPDDDSAPDYLGEQNGNDEQQLKEEPKVHVEEVKDLVDNGPLHSVETQQNKTQDSDALIEKEAAAAEVDQIPTDSTPCTVPKVRKIRIKSSTRPRRREICEGPKSPVCSKPDKNIKEQKTKKTAAPPMSSLDGVCKVIRNIEMSVSQPSSPPETTSKSNDKEGSGLGDCKSKNETILFKGAPAITRTKNSFDRTDVFSPDSQKLIEYMVDSSTPLKSPRKYQKSRPLPASSGDVTKPPKNKEKSARLKNNRQKGEKSQRTSSQVFRTTKNGTSPEVERPKAADPRYRQKPEQPEYGTYNRRNTFVEEKELNVLHKIVQEADLISDNLACSSYDRSERRNEAIRNYLRDKVKAKSANKKSQKHTSTDDCDLNDEVKNTTFWWEHIREQSFKNGGACRTRDPLVCERENAMTEGYSPESWLEGLDDQANPLLRKACLLNDCLLEDLDNSE